MAAFKLFEINEQIEIIADMLVDPETGEVLSEQEAKNLIDKYEMQKDRKIEYLCKLIKNYKAEADALKVQKLEFEKRQKTAENKANSIKNYIGYVLNGEKWKADDASVSVSYRTTKETVKIDDVEALPSDCFKNPKIESNVSKTKIKELIQAGIDVPGAHLEDSISVIIK